MVIPSIYNRKYFSVSCPTCDIEETMIFRSKVPGSFFPTRFYSFEKKAEVPPLFIYVPCKSIDKNGIEKENIFYPIKSLLGDKMPDKCPKCGGYLRKENCFVQE